VLPCDSDSSKFKSGLNSNSIPYWSTDNDNLDEDEIKEKSCTHFAYNGTANEVQCSSSNFDTASKGQWIAFTHHSNSFFIAICSRHIYDTSDYDHSMVYELDIGNCGSDYDSDWPLHPIISRASLLGIGLAIGQIIGIF